MYQYTNEDGIKRQQALRVSTSALLLLGTVFKNSVHSYTPAVRPKGFLTPASLGPLL